jgi:putative hydrolase of the HAD superfamily
MILIFDLDETLYDERRYVESGLRAVAAYGEAQYGWPQAESFRRLCEILDSQGRGSVFDRWLETHGFSTRNAVLACVAAYRRHTPELSLYPEAARLLPRLARRFPLYLITDGHKIVQRLKVEALGIAPLFRKIIITHCYGRARAKPSPYCFDLVRKAERCAWADLVYVGDNPAKDFVALNRKGGETVRVRTGLHRDAVAAPGYEAHHIIADLSELPDVLKAISPRSSRG